jgi:hypothetical protein
MLLKVPHTRTFMAEVLVLLLGGTYKKKKAAMMS